MPKCHQCRAALPPGKTIGRTDDCPSCGADLHVCANCRFNDPNLSDGCREPAAEPVFEKERSNYCEFFELGDPPGGPVKETINDARARFQSLFKK